MGPVDRRTFLRGVAAISAATAGSALVPGALQADDELQATKTDPSWARSPCRFCGVGCGLLIGIEDGHAGAVKGDPDSAVSKGLACAKGYYSAQALYGRDRIRHRKARELRVMRARVQATLQDSFPEPPTIHFMRRSPP